MMEREEKKMAIVASLQISHPFPSSLNLPTSFSHKRQQHTVSKRALEPEKENPDTTETPPPDPADPFENRLSRVRLKYRSGTGKKAELRKSKKSGSSSSSKKKAGVFLPPIPLKEPVSAGMKVDFGFTPYTERLNGRLAALGLAALLLVELSSGKSIVSYHTPPILFIQIYFIAAVSAVFIKYEKEKASFWPESPKKT